MIKTILFFLFICWNFNSSAQERVLEEKIDKIPIDNRNVFFLDTILKEYDCVIKEKADSVFLFYEEIPEYKYAVLFWVKNEVIKCRAYYYDRFTEAIREDLENDSLKKIQFYTAYSQFLDSNVRFQGPVHVSHDYVVYGQFYFGKRSEVFSALESKIDYDFSNEKDFSTAYKRERYRIVNKFSK